MKPWLVSLVLLLVAAPVAAQIPLQADAAAKYGIAAYATEADEPPCSSFQSQYTRAPFTRTVHAHIEPCGPTYGIVSGDLTRKFTVVTFCLNGRVTGVDGRLYRGPALDIVWDATGTSTPPVMVSTASPTCDGNEPGAVKSWTGHYTMHQSATDRHGWIAPLIYAHAHDDAFNVDLNPEGNIAFWTEADPTAPLNVLAEPKSASLNSDTNPREGTRWGAQVEERNANRGGWEPPSTPLTGVFTTTAAGYGYTSDLKTRACMEHRYDTDLHHGHEGMTVASVCVPTPAQGTPVVPVNIDPAVAASSTPPVGFAPNAHRDVLAWFETSNDGTEISSTWLVKAFTLADGTVPTVPTPPPPPPPPPVPLLQSCTLTLTGTSTDGGHTVTVTVSPVTWACR